MQRSLFLFLMCCFLVALNNGCSRIDSYEKYMGVWKSESENPTGLPDVVKISREGESVLLEDVRLNAAADSSKPNQLALEKTEKGLVLNGPLGSRAPLALTGNDLTLLVGSKVFKRISSDDLKRLSTEVTNEHIKCVALKKSYAEAVQDFEKQYPISGFFSRKPGAIEAERKLRSDEEVRRKAVKYCFVPGSVR
jgi:hypothetical protein